MPEQFNFRQLKRDVQNDRFQKEINEGQEHGWNLYDSTLEQFALTFAEAIPQEYLGAYDKDTTVEEYAQLCGAAFEKYIEDTVSRSPSVHHTAIEFGGPGSVLFSEFKKGLFEKTLGVCLSDVRDSEQKEYDKACGHTVVTGDMFDGRNIALYASIKEKLGTEHVNLIISRMMGPLDKLSMNPLVLDRVVRTWYSRLAPGGVMFLQFDYLSIHNGPSHFQHRHGVPVSSREDNKVFVMPTQQDVQEWCDAIRAHFGDVIEIQLGGGVIRIYKKEGAPAELPKGQDLFSGSSK